jgi:hypothetical protein
MLTHLTIVDSTIVLSDVDVAREAVALIEPLNSDWWASATEKFIYNEFADAFGEGLRIGGPRRDYMMSEDGLVLARTAG